MLYKMSDFMHARVRLIVRFLCKIKRNMLDLSVDSSHIRMRRLETQQHGVRIIVHLHDLVVNEDVRVRRNRVYVCKLYDAGAVVGRTYRHVVGTNSHHVIHYDHFNFQTHAFRVCQTLSCCVYTKLHTHTTTYRITLQFEPNVSFFMRPHGCTLVVCGVSKFLANLHSSTTTTVTLP